MDEVLTLSDVTVEGQKNKIGQKKVGGVDEALTLFNVEV